MGGGRYQSLDTHYPNPHTIQTEGKQQDGGRTPFKKNATGVSGLFKIKAFGQEAKNRRWSRLTRHVATLGATCPISKPLIWSSWSSNALGGSKEKPKTQ